MDLMKKLLKTISRLFTTWRTTVVILDILKLLKYISHQRKFIFSSIYYHHSKNELMAIMAQTTGAVSWRASDIIHKKNEVFLDMIESINVLISATNVPLQHEIHGRVMLKTFLTGTP